MVEEDKSDQEYEEGQPKDKLITNARHEIEIKERITPCYLTKYEKARVIGARAVQISRNCPVLVSLGKDEIDPI